MQEAVRKRVGGIAAIGHVPMISLPIMAARFAEHLPLHIMTLENNMPIHREPHKVPKIGHPKRDRKKERRRKRGYA